MKAVIAIIVSPIQLYSMMRKLALNPDISPSGSHTVLVFIHQNTMAIFQWELPLTGH